MMIFSNALAQGKPDTCPCVLVAKVEAIEQTKQPLLVLRTDSDSVVLYADAAGTIRRDRLDRHHMFLVALAKFQCIGNQILKKHSQLHGVAVYHR